MEDKKDLIGVLVNLYIKICGLLLILSSPLIILGLGGTGEVPHNYLLMGFSRFGLMLCGIAFMLPKSQGSSKSLKWLWFLAIICLSVFIVSYYSLVPDAEFARIVLLSHAILLGSLFIPRIKREFV